MMLSAYKNKRVLVTGGAGFIGAHLTERLVALGAQVTVLDNLSTGSLDNLRRVIHQINFLQSDITSVNDCLKATAHKDVIFHLAALVSVQESIAHPELCTQVNVDGTKNILDGCTKNTKAHVVFSSSAAVYGNRNNSCSEKDNPNPLTPYAESKLLGEKLCRQYAKKYGISTTILRYFNVYGPRQNPNGEYAAVIAKFISTLKEGKPLTIFGSGKQTRDFIPVERAVDANILMGLEDEMKGEVFNIASGKSMSLLDVVEQLKGELELHAVESNHVPARSGDIEHSAANCDKYQKFAFEKDGFAVESKDISLKFIPQPKAAKTEQPL